MVFFRSWATKGKKTLAHAGINNERAFCVNVKNSTDPPLFFSNFLPFLSLSLSLSLSLFLFRYYYFIFFLFCDVYWYSFFSPFSNYSAFCLFLANSSTVKVKVASLLSNVNKSVRNSLQLGYILRFCLSACLSCVVCFLLFSSFV